METKFCHKCKKAKPITEFYERNRGGCKKCVRKYQNEYYKQNYATPLQKEQLPKDHKRCSKCKEVKPMMGYYKDQSATDGYNHRCKVCMDKGRQERRQRERERNLLYTVPLPEGYKVCSKCLKMLPMTEFYKVHDKPKSQCKTCERGYILVDGYKIYQWVYFDLSPICATILVDKYRPAARPAA